MVLLLFFKKERDRERIWNECKWHILQEWCHHTWNPKVVSVKINQEASANATTQEKSVDEVNKTVENEKGSKLGRIYRNLQVI
jgi:stalled ribosome rescue protein Dom34